MRRLSAFAVMIGCLLFVYASPAFGSPPANDNFANRADLGNGFTASVTGSNVDATLEPDEPHRLNEGASIWYRWTAPATGKFFIACSADFGDLNAGSRAWVYAGSTLASLSLASNGSPNCSVPGSGVGIISLTATKDTEYKIGLYGEAGGGPGPGQGNISFSLTPTDDIFALATDLGSVGSTSVTGNNGGYSKEAGEPQHAGNQGGASKWYTWTAPTSGRYIVDLCDSDFDTLLGVYTGGAVDSLTQVAANDDSCGTSFTRSKVALTTVAGTTYRIAVDGKYAPFVGPTDLAEGQVALKIREVPHDFFADAGDLGNATSASASGSNVDATKESGEPDHAGNVGGASIWYRWTAPQTDQFTVDTCESNLDTVIGVYTGSAVNALSEVGASVDGCRGRSAVTFDAISGTTYRIAVDGFHNPGALMTQTGSFDLHLNAGPPPDQDGDGVSDFSDNCMSDANADQEDLDADGIGDACDPHVDVDGDSVDDADDACPEEWGESLDGCPLRELTLDVFGPGALAVTDFLGTYFCPDDFCDALYDDGDEALIEPVANPGAGLVSFSGGGCSLSTPSCVVTFAADQHVVATFVKTAPTPTPPSIAPPAKKKCKRKISRKHRRCKKRKAVRRLRAS